MDYSSIDFVDLLERVGLRNVRMTAGGVEVNFSCHRGEHNHGDENPSAYLNSTNGKFFCWGCKFSGLSPAELVADVQIISVAAAERFLRETYGIEFDEPVGGSFLAEIEARLRPPADPPPVARPPESWLSSVRLDWYAEPEPFQQYMLDRGLSRETLTEFDIGFDYLSDRVTIPVRALDGSLFGVKGRDWQGSHPAKFMVLGDRPGSPRLRYGFGTYEVSEVVFGLHRRCDVKRAVCVEAEFDTAALWQMGVERPIATNGSRMSERQARLIIDEVEEVVLLYDADAAGEEGVERAVWLLEPYVRVRVATPLDVDPCDALRIGAQLDVLRAIERAESSIARRTISV